MEVSGKLHTPAASPQGKTPLAPIFILHLLPLLPSLIFPLISYSFPSSFPHFSSSPFPLSCSFSWPSSSFLIRTVVLIVAFQQHKLQMGKDAMRIHSKCLTSTSWYGHEATQTRYHDHTGRIIRRQCNQWQYQNICSWELDEKWLRMMGYKILGRGRIPSLFEDTARSQYHFSRWTGRDLNWVPLGYKSVSSGGGGSRFLKPGSKRKIPRLLWNPNVHYHVYNSPPLVTTLSIF